MGNKARTLENSNMAEARKGIKTVKKITPLAKQTFSGYTQPFPVRL